MSKLLKILSIGVTLTSCGVTMAVKNNDCNKDHKRACPLVKTSGISKRYPKNSDTKRFIRTPQGIQRYLSSNEIGKICMLIRQGHLSKASIHKLCDAIEFHMRGHNGYSNDYYGWNGYNSYYNTYDWGNWYSDPYYEDNTCDGTCNWYEYNNDYRGTYDWGTQDNGYNRHPYGYGCR